jgi:Flp pilus assembly protein TadG
MRSPRRCRDSGALTLSYVIVFPVFLLALMAIVQAALFYLARQAALAAARHGVDAARVLHAPAGAGPAAALAFARSAGSGYLLGPSASSGGSTPTTIEITVHGRVPSLVPGLTLTVSMSQDAAAPVERFTAP